MVWAIGVRLLSFQLGWDKGRVNWLALPSFCYVLRIEKYVLHMFVFCYFHVALASLQHGFHGRRKGWVLRKLLWVEIILFPFTKRCSWSPLQVPCLCSMPLELYARKQYDLSNWASGRRGTGWASMPWQLKPKNRFFSPSWINILGGQNASHVSNHPGQVNRRGQLAQGAASQRRVAMATWPLGESFSGLWRLISDLRPKYMC